MNVFYQIKMFFAGVYTEYWASLDTTMKAAFIGVFSAIMVMYLQNWQERKRDEEKQSGTEKDKLQYLNFLMVDSRKIFYSYNECVNKMKSVVEANPFSIPDMRLYPPNSLSTIAHKLDQEEYYLAFANQLKSDEIAEVFFIYNTLDHGHTFALNGYRNQFEKLIEDKEKYASQLELLMNSTAQYINDHPIANLDGQDQIIHQQLGTLVVGLNNDAQFQNHLTSRETRDAWLRDSRYRFVNEVNNILQNGQESTYRDLRQKVRSAISYYDVYTARISNAIGALESNRVSMINTLKRLDIILPPFTEYISQSKFKSKFPADAYIINDNSNGVKAQPPPANWEPDGTPEPTNNKPQP